MNKGIIAGIAVITIILVGSLYLAYWYVEAEDCYMTHERVRPDLNSHLGNEMLDEMNKEYYSCLEQKSLPVLEKVRIADGVDFVKG